MRMTFTCPGGSRVEAAFDGFRVLTDQPVDHGGDGEAPAPFDLFLASIGTCAAYYVLEFLRQRGFDGRDAELELETFRDPRTHMVSSIELRVSLPPEVPEKYRSAVLRAANLCSVKRHLEHPPEITTIVSMGEDVRSRSSLP